MGRPVIGIICNTVLVDSRIKAHAVGERNLLAVTQAAQATPVLIPALTNCADAGAFLDVVDGILLVGGRANVHPERFGLAADPRHEPYDEGRDAVALALARACVEKGVPLFGVCRGLQEMNVAFGGTLHPEISEIPGRMNHRAPRIETGEMHPDPAVIFAERHDVTLSEGGILSKLLGVGVIRVNSLHGQGVLEPGPRVVVEGRAEDGTIEAISIRDARAFALGVQWHAEFDPSSNRVNRTLFEAFGAAARERRKRAGRAGPGTAR